MSESKVNSERVEEYSYDLNDNKEGVFFVALANNPYAQYKQQAITTATPEKLLIMLFDGAIRFSGQARNAIEEKNIEKTNEFLKRCQAIVSELMNSLNMDFEISHQLYPLYEYINYNFLQANLHKDIKYLDEADLYLKDLRETWIEAAKLIKQQNNNSVEEGK